jgi:hypothetical protein
MPAYLARTGLAVFAMLFAIALLTERPAAGRALVAASNAIDLPQLQEIVPAPIDAAVFAVAIADLETLSSPAVVPAPVQTDAVVLASWYGPGFYGNRTACGQRYTPEILGVAHLTLPCGTLLTLTYGSRSVSVAVIDRGPYIAGRTLDLSNATKLALSCTDLCTLRMQIAQ